MVEDMVLNEMQQNSLLLCLRTNEEIKSAVERIIFTAAFIQINPNPHAESFHSSSEGGHQS